MAKQISVTGVVQGVGFRPFVYGLATRLDLHGWVRNTSAGVEILVDGQESKVESFIHSLMTEAPPLARIDSVDVSEDISNGDYATFDIRPSADHSHGYQPISPDVGICADCERELFDPHDRRYLYPFINCTNCGPRYTIIRDIPYDRPHTTMAGFDMCPDCRTEYENPLNRRFHAQPVACPKCGPFVELRETQPHASNSHSRISTIECRTSAILKARRLLHQGAILAVKGIGGFHLACDASNPLAVRELRRRKGRADKPLAIMVADVEMIQTFCKVNAEERDLLTGSQKPIVLLAKKTLRGSGAINVCNEIAPHLDTLGVMLPYTPLHHLLLNQTDPRLMLEPAPSVLVMTSGNFSEEPIAADNLEALQILHPLADAFLLHDRDIYVKCDDSVMRVDRRSFDTINEKRTVRTTLPNANVADRDGVSCPSSVVFLRRSRGYAPYPVPLPFATKPTLAVGGELKNTFCLTRDRYAFVSQHIGDMENADTFEAFEQGVRHLSHIFRVQPELVACDLHPGYFTTHFAGRLNSLPVAVQHHHAHIAACMADNGLDDRRVIGLAFDGTGYGTDGAIWGGEVLLASYLDFERLAHLEYLPLPGGDSAIRHPWRIAVGYAHALGIDLDNLPFLRKLDPQALKIVRQQVEKKLNVAQTSSMGRLFDAVASLIGIRNDVNYEAQAAIEMEVLSKPFVAMVKSYPFFIEEAQSGLVIQLKGLLEAVVKGLRSNESAEMAGARFHKTIADISVGVCKYARTKTDLNEVALSGGVWQNQVLLNLVRDGLEREGFMVYFHRQVPTNDGGLALGQAVIANYLAR